MIAVSTAPGLAPADNVPSEQPPQYRLPAEWEPQAATWLIWPGHLQPVGHWRGLEQELRLFSLRYGEQLRRCGTLHWLVGHDGLPMEQGHGPQVPITSNDIWLRDTAPTFLVPERPAPLRAVCPLWNGYGGKYHPCDADAAVATALANRLQCEVLPLALHLEGGAIETDGAGTLLASRGAIAGNKRNTNLPLADLESCMAAAMGCSAIIWIDACLQGDDTDGHVDQLVRFVAPGRVLIAAQPDPRDPNHAVLERLRQQLCDCRDAAGRRLEIIPIDLPARLEIDGAQMPASYLNFYIHHAHVFVPVFGCEADHAALSTMARCFPERQVVPMDCRLLLRGRGGLHCISRQQPLVV